MFVLSDQQSKNQEDITFKMMKESRAADPHFREAETERLVFLEK